MKKTIGRMLMAALMLAFMICGYACAETADARQMTYIRQCPILPEPTDFSDGMYPFSAETTRRNDQITKIAYYYTGFDAEASLEAELGAYEEGLAQLGFIVENHTVYAGEIKLATLSLTSNVLRKHILEVDVALGNENLTDMPAPLSPEE